MARETIRGSVRDSWLILLRLFKKSGNICARGYPITTHEIQLGAHKYERAHIFYYCAHNL